MRIDEILGSPRPPEQRRKPIRTGQQSAMGSAPKETSADAAKKHVEDLVKGLKR